MKSVFSLAALLLLCSSSLHAAIEFSEDVAQDGAEVSAVAQPLVLTESPAVGSESPAATHSSTPPTALPMTLGSVISQSAGPIGKPARDILDRGPMSGMLGMFGGGGAGLGNEAKAGTANEGDYPNSATPTTTAAESGDSMVLPEPATILVWTLLAACCGIAYVRRR